MRAEESPPAENVIPLHGARPESAVQETPAAAGEPGPPPAMVLNAERGIINTGTVHGGQHVTTVEVPGHLHRGAGDGV